MTQSNFSMSNYSFHNSKMWNISRIKKSVFLPLVILYYQVDRARAPSFGNSVGCRQSIAGLRNRQEFSTIRTMERRSQGMKERRVL